MPEHPAKPTIVLPGLDPKESRTENGPERRAAFRLPFTAAAVVCDIRSGTRITGRCSDLGPGGCYIDTLSPFSVSAVVHVRIERELHEFEALAVITNAHISMGMGLAFTAIKPEHQTVLQSWIEESTGERRPKPEPMSAGPEAGTLEAIANLRHVLNELINLMVRKKVISENEGAGLLRQMFR